VFDAVGVVHAFRAKRVRCGELDDARAELEAGVSWEAPPRLAMGTLFVFVGLPTLVDSDRFRLAGIPPP
jgi:hypothetical protein